MQPKFKARISFVRGGEDGSDLDSPNPETSKQIDDFVANVVKEIIKANESPAHSPGKEGPKDSHNESNSSNKE